MREAMRQYGILTEIHERAQVIALVRFYGARWRPWDPEDGRSGNRVAGVTGSLENETPPL